ncbi:hypothetical protein [Demequina iriomotensis]|uniref:hypothetical protein n=1 Tax=Demequina iriomotensis TaxID=1536641 RepID=UPI000780D7FF|nr:hypothetical protein [Demequina iriomotensis]
MDERERDGGGISRRGVIIGGAWAVPVVLVATAPASATVSPENPLDGSYVVGSESGNDDLYLVTIHLPEGVVLEGATLTVHWEPTNGNGATVEVTSGGSAGGTSWQPGATDDPDVVFIAPGPITSDDQFLVTFDKGQNGSTWTATLSGTVDGQDASATYVGQL